MNDVPEEIKESRTNYPTTNTTTAPSQTYARAAVYPTTYFDFYKNVLNISSYESSYTYNGVSYRTCTVYLENKSETSEYLARTFLDQKVIKGKLVNINDVNQFAEGTIRLLGAKAAEAASGIIANPLANCLISHIIDFIPVTQREQYLVIGQNVLISNHISVSEFIRYIYVYDTDSDEWILSGSANKGYTKPSIDLVYRDGGDINSTNIKEKMYFEDGYGTIRQNAVSWFAMNKKMGCTSFAPLDQVIKVIKVDYKDAGGTTPLYTINLCADQYPGYIRRY